MTRTNKEDLLIFEQEVYTVTRKDGTVYRVALYEGDTDEDIERRIRHAETLYTSLKSHLGHPTGEGAIKTYVAFLLSEPDTFPNEFKSIVQGWFVPTIDTERGGDSLIFLSAEHFLEIIETAIQKGKQKNEEK